MGLVLQLQVYKNLYTILHNGIVSVVTDKALVSGNSVYIP